MSESEPREVASRPKRYRFGLRWLLLVVLMFSVVFAWFARESLRVKQQARLINDLAQIEVRVRQREPTGLALVARKLLGHKDVWLRQRMRESWFGRPRVLVTWTTTDEQAPELVKRIKQLGVVRELHLEQAPVTEQGIGVLKNELPGVAVLTRAELISRGAGQPTEHFAYAAVQFLVIAAAGLLCITIVLVWPLLRWPRNRHFPPVLRSVINR